jgi:hypothetical protein
VSSDSFYKREQQVSMLALRSIIARLSIMCAIILGVGGFLSAVIPVLLAITGSYEGGEHIGILSLTLLFCNGPAYLLTVCYSYAAPQKSNRLLKIARIIILGPPAVFIPLVVITGGIMTTIYAFMK